MKRIALYLTLSLPAAPAVLLAQNPSITLDSPRFSMFAAGQGAAASHQAAAPVKYAASTPFSRLALAVGIGAGGINMQAAVEANRYLNLRGIGNYFSYTVDNIKINGDNGANGINVSGKLNFASAGIALDYYPFPNHGFRLSPGVTFYNQNGISATGVSSPGSSFTLDSQKYYSDAVNPLNVTASLGLNTHQQAFSMTTGWGNLLSRKGGHWSVPFELGAVFTGVPTLKIGLTGYACETQADAAINGVTCVNMATDSTAQANLNAQIAKYKKDLDPLKVYPILSVGLGYNFKIR
ncbi:MAG: hypothetical protein ABSF23_13190 [Terracidiphilus sp.]